MATYKEIQVYIKKRYGVTVKTCWIADIKEMCGLNPRIAPNRYSPAKRKYPCPLSKVTIIKEALKFFGMV